MFRVEIDSPGRLATAAHPRAGDRLDEDVRLWRANGVDSVVSLLTPDEVRDLGLEGEARACERAGMTFQAFPIADRGAPDSVTRTAPLIQGCGQRILEGQGVLIHCWAGIGRSSLIAACVMGSLGVPPAAAFARISAARRLPVPETADQLAWARVFFEA